VSRLNGIDTATFDAVVIGGGMAGAGVARDLALRGASVALLGRFRLRYLVEVLG
jgi:glycerol-3-phosphate dehydrogenase